jgi:hypothetical protein
VAALVDRVDVMWEALDAALRGVEGCRVYEDPGATFDPPALVVIAPAVVWDGYRQVPSEATFTVLLAVKKDERANQRLRQLRPLVAAAIDSVPDAVLVRAIPGSTGPIGSGGALPAYLFEVECAL